MNESEEHEREKDEDRMLEDAARDSCKIIVEGVTVNGGRFRPSDWVERFAGNLAEFGDDNRLTYSPYLQPTIHNGTKSLLVDPRLQSKRPELFKQLVGFAKANRLRVAEACGVPELEEQEAGEGDED
jgi:hypothetical protein